MHQDVGKPLYGEVSQEMRNGGKPHFRKYCRCSCFRCFIIIVILAATLFVYNDNLLKLNTGWLPNLWAQHNSSTYKANTVNITKFNIHPTNSTLEPPNPGETNDSSSHIRVLDIANKTTEIIKAVLYTPTPYVSPGAYHVEYPHEYHFIVDEPEKCRQQQPFLVLMVPVAPHNRVARDAVRSTWGSERLVLDKVVCLFFLLALPSGDGEQQIQEQVLQESREHQDMLQSDFKDSYKNLTIKTMVMLEWLSSRCPNASYAMKIDSDMFLNVHTLINMLLTAPKQNYMTGLVANGAVVLRDPSSKWYLPWEVFPQSNYPRYALGLGYVLSLDLPRKLVAASRHVRAIYIEDVYLGLCMRQLGISPSDPPDWTLFNVSPVSYNRCTYSRLIATTTLSVTDQLNAWQDLQKHGQTCP